MPNVKISRVCTFLAATLSIYVLMFAQPAEAARYYNNGQLKLLFEGSTIYAKGEPCVGNFSIYNDQAGSAAFTLDFDKDSRLKFQLQCENAYTKYESSAEGTWRLAGDQICIKSADQTFNQTMHESGENCLSAQEASFGFELVDRKGDRVWFFQVENHPKYSSKEDILAALKEVKATPIQVAAAPARSVSSAAADSAMWESIKYSSQVSDFQRYLEQYPNGLFVALASNQIKDLVGRESNPDASSSTFNDIDFGTYYALVIGIDNYKHVTKLGTAIRDAKAVAAVLKDAYGFKVQTLIDPDRTDIVDAFDEYRETLTEDDNLLIYYAGHGWLDEDAEEGYWMSAKAKSNRRSQWVSNATITKTLKTLPAKHVMVVADSCYSGTLTRAAAVGFRDKDYFKRMARKKARVAMVSGGLEPVSDDSGSGHSPFAKAFIDALTHNKDVIDGTRLFSEIRRPVILNAQQTPEYSDVRNAGHDGGDFLFVRKQ